MGTQEVVANKNDMAISARSLLIIKLKCGNPERDEFKLWVLLKLKKRPYVFGMTTGFKGLVAVKIRISQRSVQREYANNKQQVNTAQKDT